MVWTVPHEQPFDEFVWDEDKRAINIRTHGVDFQDAALALLALHVVSPAKVSGREPWLREEDRWLALAPIAGVVVAIIYTVRNGVCRIISADAASRNERKAYNATLSG